MYVCQSPQKGALLRMGKNIRSPSTDPHADGRLTYKGVQLVKESYQLTHPLSLSNFKQTVYCIASTVVFKTSVFPNAPSFSEPQLAL
jgi:hypothetical protein